MAVYKYQVEISDVAKEDIIRNINYISYNKKSPGIAQTVLRGFRKQIENLSDSPKRHSLDEDEELSKLQIRKHYFKHYKIYYIVDDVQKIVYILRVLHMLVDSKALLIHMLEE